MAILLQMPDDEMNLILEQCDLESILTLRKVCRDLRSFVDVFKPDAKFLAISIFIRNRSWAKGESVTLEVRHDTYRDLDIRYEKHERGCSRYVSGSNFDPIYETREEYHKDSIDRQTKVIDGGNCFDEFIRDFEIMLRFQRTSVMELMNFSLYVEEDSEIFIDRINEILQKLTIPIKSEMLKMDLQAETRIMKILPFFDEKHLKSLSISIRNVDNSFETEGAIAKIADLVQWKNATSLNISSIPMDEIERCLHFTHIYMRSDFGYCLEDIEEMKEMFLRSTKLETFQKDFMCVDDQVYEILGPNFHTIRDEKKQWDIKQWFYRVPNSTKILMREVTPRSVKLCYVTEANVPKNVQIQR